MLKNIDYTELFSQERIPLTSIFRPLLSTGNLPPDPTFPYGRVEDINYNQLDPAGHNLIKEINKRPWIATVSYCSGHPFNRPKEEDTPYTEHLTYKGKPRWEFAEEMHKLNKQVRGHRISKDIYRTEIKDLIEASRSWFNLTMNVYKTEPFLQWMRSFFVAYTNTFLQFQLYRPPEVTLNPLFPIPNYTLVCGYFGVEHRTGLHTLLSESIRNIPI